MSSLQRRLSTDLIGVARFTRQEAADAAGVPLEQAIRLWHALGFADPGADERVFTSDDVHALRTTRELIDEGVIDAALTSSLTRTLGQAMSRLAEWQVERLIARLAHSPELVLDEDATVAFVARVLPQISEIQQFVWRRHLAAFVDRALSESDEGLDGPAARRQMVGFVDIGSFTSLSRGLDDPGLAAVLERFEATAAELVAVGHGRVVKSLGDEVLFVADDAVAAAEIALGMIEFAEADPILGGVHAGLAAGSVLSRLGDVFGPVVNVASRLTSLARTGSVLVDVEFARLIRDHPLYELRRLRPVAVRGYAHLHPSRLRRAD